MERPTLRLVILSILALTAATDVRAQCPDGSAPPCSVASRPARAAVSVPSASDRARRFLILPFRNVTRQPEQEWLVEGATTMLSDALSRWQGITVVPDEKLYPALKRAAITPGAVADQASVRRVAEETGGWTAVTGEVLATGGRLRVSARAWDVPTNRELVRAASEIPSTGDIRAAFDSVSLRLLRSVGLDSASADLANTSTRDLDAYRAYVRGLAHVRRGEVRSALTAFEEATRRDSTFALAWARLADMLNAMEPTAIVQPMSRPLQASTRAAALSGNLPTRQRSLLLASNALFRAQFTETRRLIDTVLKLDPNDVEALHLLTALELFDPLLVDAPGGGKRPRGSPNAAARTAKRLTQLDPSRHSIFGQLAGIYAGAGIPGSSPVIGIVRETASYPELMQMVQRRENVRMYYPLLRDSLVLVPAESLSTIPDDSLKAMRKAARGAARAWAERWLAVEGDQSPPHQLMSALLDLDDEIPGALRELAKAESLGVQSPTFVPAARRIVYLAKMRDYGGASRISDSLAAAGFFANPSNLLYSAEAAAWSFNLHLLRGRVTSAQALLQQSIALRRLLAPSSPVIELSGFGTLLGSGDPDAEPRLTREFRRMTLDSLVARLDAFVASPQLSPWLPMILPLLAETADTTRKRLATLLPVADALAAKGHAQLAFYLAANTVSEDSTLEPVAARYAWYRTSAEAYNAAKRAVLARFKPSSANVNSQRAVFEWRVNDSTPFTRNRAETPIGRTENRWMVTVDAGRRYYRLSANSATKVMEPPTSGTLSDLLPPTANLSVIGGNLDAGGVRRDTTFQAGIQLRTEIAPQTLRLVVSDSTFIGTLRRERPTHAVFRFEPCIVPVGTLGQRQCFEEKVPITYAP